MGWELSFPWGAALLALAPLIPKSSFSRLSSNFNPDMIQSNIVSSFIEVIPNGIEYMLGKKGGGREFVPADSKEFVYISLGFIIMCQLEGDGGFL